MAKLPGNPSSHGTGRISLDQLGALGSDSVFETDVLVFHPERVFIGNRVYIGHRTILKGYHRNELRIGDGSWIGQDCFFHSAGGLEIGRNVGIGPAVRIITSVHREEGRSRPIIHSALRFAPVRIEDDADIGIGATILPGVIIGRGAQIGAASVVTHDVPEYAVAAGNPARVLRYRSET